MCGLSGIFHYISKSVAVNRGILEAMSAAQSHRGPDGQGIWIAENQRLGFSHRRLAILDTHASGSQPMASDDGGVHIVFNGEIYNFQALKTQLQAEGDRFHSHSDTEVLLHLWRRFGPGMVHHLRGMFAFALWDETQHCLFAARDPMGIKPFYYHDDGSSLLFASQVKALQQAIPEVSVCPAGLVGFHLMGSVPEPFTLYRQIRSLPAGHSLLCRQDETPSIQAYWSMGERVRRLAAAPAAAPSLDALMKDSVAHHLVSDVSVGLFLSAGIDSGVLAGLAAELGQSLTAFTLGFDDYKGTAEDETELAAAVAAHYGLPHSVAYVSRDEYFEEFPKILAAMDQPSIDGVNTYFVARAAKAAGFKVALSGLGADELFAGYGAFAEIPNTLRFTKPLSQLPLLGVGMRKAGRFVLPPGVPSKSVGLVEYGACLADAYLLRRCVIPPWELGGYLDPDILRDGWEQLAVRRSLADLEADAPGYRLGLTMMESCQYMRNQLLRDADWAGMAHGVEIRVPFVDVPLIEGVIQRILAGSSATKADLAATPSRPLPARVLSRRKTGFNVPFNRWRGMAAKEYGSWILKAYAGRGFGQALRHD